MVSITRKGYIELYYGDSLLSRHTAVEEAYESALEHLEANQDTEGYTGLYRVKYPDREIDVSSILVKAPAPRTISAPQDFIAVATGNYSISLGWDRPATNAAYVSGYALEFSNDGGTTWAAVPGYSSGLTATHSSLSAGTTYNYRVRATGTLEGAWATSEATTDALSVDAWPTQDAVAYVPALRNRRGFAMNNRHAFTGGNPTILEVTNLNAAGAGSFAAAWGATGNRIIVFNVSGTIDLAGSTATPGGGNVWVATQTAPAPGICFLNGNVRVTDSATNVLVQHLRVHLTEGFEAAGGLGTNADAMSASTSTPVDNVVFDHCEGAFAYDETFSVSQGALRVDWIECAAIFPLYEPLLRQDKTNDQPPGSNHAFAMLINTAGANTFVSVQGSFFAHCQARIPRACAEGLLIGNSIFYNGKNRFAEFFAGNAASSFNIIGNRYKGGPDGNPIPVQTTNTLVAGSKIYVADNMRNGTIPADQWTLVTADASLESGTQLGDALPGGFVPWSNEDAMETHIANRVGAFPNSRSAALAQALSDYTNGTGSGILLSTSTNSPGASSALAQNTTDFQADYEAAGYVWADRFSDHPTEAGRKNIEVYLLDLGEAA